MKRIIFSIFSDNLEKNHPSATEYKRDQFIKHKTLLEKSQREYAHKCSADYILFETNMESYDDIQFSKILKFDSLLEEYDEALYLDFDVIPNTDKSFFEHNDLNNVCAYSFSRKLNNERLKKKIELDDFDTMNVFSKGCCKISMLLLHDIISDYDILNTGVLGMNKKSAYELNMSERLEEAKQTFVETLTDNVYPEEITKNWRINNEVFITYIIEKYKVPFHNIGMPWNFILDDNYPQKSAASYFLHYVNKRFKFD